jgi:hypothetical protein
LAPSTKTTYALVMSKRLRGVVRRSRQKAAAGLARARAMLERERLRHSVLSETFFVLTRLEERLDAELSRLRRPARRLRFS